MGSFASALENSRRFSAVVEKMEDALRNDPNNLKLRLGLGSAKRRAIESQKVFEEYAAKNHVDLIRYRIENAAESYAVKAVADSISHFQGSFTGIVDFLEAGPKERATYSNKMVDQTKLELAYTFPGSLGVVLSVQNDRDLISGRFDKAVDVLSEFLRINDTNSALDASRHLGLGLVSQLCAWVDANSSWDNNVDYVWKRSDGIARGEFVSQDKFHEISDIFKNAEEEEINPIEVRGILIGLDLDASFHFVVPNGKDYRGKLSDQFVKVPTTVGKEYVAKIAEKSVRKVATGKTVTTYQLLNLN